MSPMFSIVIPAHNAEKTIEKCLLSAAQQENAEIIVVDSASTDGTFSAIAQFVGAEKLRETSMTVEQLDVNKGAGPARDVGVQAACGQWIMFLDADDELAPNATHDLAEYINTHLSLLDIVRFHPSEEKFFGKGKPYLLNQCAALRLDGSVIYSAFRTTVASRLTFREGVHEDVDYLFKAYCLADVVGYLQNPIYRKGPKGITKTITKSHIDGFLVAWENLKQEAIEQGVAQEYLNKGVRALIATRVREIFNKNEGQENLLEYLYSKVTPYMLEACWEPTLQDTQYAKVARLFVSRHWEHIPHLFHQTWSCKDLQNSAYLGPDEIRACCKRFFVNGEQKGDVVLLNKTSEFTPKNLQRVKRDLLDDINAGEKTSCFGCPWLEFDSHSPISQTVTYLSMEQHSVCQLDCSYCPTQYKDGRRPTYDAEFLASSILAPYGFIVWGGGEPTISKEFKSLAPLAASLRVRQRVLSNCVKYSSVLQGLLDQDDVELVVSIDAGLPQTFAEVRGADKMDVVLKNISRYAEKAAERVTIKYILTEGNCDKIQTRAFINRMRQEALLCCNFQISCDFRKEEAQLLEIICAVDLMNGLLSAGAECVFFDDLARIRFSKQRSLRICKEFFEIGMAGMLSAHTYKEVMIWGTGEQARLLQTQTLFFENVKCAYNPDDASYVKEDDPQLPIVIAASQAYPKIFHNLKRMGFNNRILKGAIL